MSEILNEQSKELEEGAVERKTDVAEAAAGELEESAASAQPAEEVPSEETDEQDFSKALEESLNSMNNDQKVVGIVMASRPRRFRLTSAESTPVTCRWTSTAQTPPQTRRRISR